VISNCDRFFAMDFERMLQNRHPVSPTETSISFARGDRFLAGIENDGSACPVASAYPAKAIVHREGCMSENCRHSKSVDLSIALSV
jgi:hypothetical protein